MTQVIVAVTREHVEGHPAIELQKVLADMVWPNVVGDRLDDVDVVGADRVGPASHGHGGGVQPSPGGGSVEAPSRKRPHRANDRADLFELRRIQHLWRAPKARPDSEPERLRSRLGCHSRGARWWDAR